MKKSHHILLYMVLSCLISISIYYPNFTAQWGIIDDHEIMAFLGPDHNLKFSEIWGMLMESEAGNPCVTTRYRPSYYLLHLLETAAWGFNPLIWYSFRVFLAGSTTFIIFLLMDISFGTLLGVLGTLCLLSLRSWAEIWARLGPAETYAFPLTVIYCYAYAELWKSKHSNQMLMWWLTWGLSAVLAMGAKENYLVLGLTSIPLTFRVLRQSLSCSINRNAILIINIIVYLVCVSISMVILFALRKQGIDLYANPTSFSSRLFILIKGYLSVTQLLAHFPLLLCFLIVMLTKFKGMRRYSGQYNKVLIAEVILMVIWDSQFIFYNGKWPTGTRYDFPGIIAGLLAYLVLLNEIPNLSRIIFLGKEEKAKNSVLLFICLYITIVGIPEIAKCYEITDRNRITTTEFTNRLEYICSKIENFTDIPIVIDLNSTAQYEPVHSIRRFLSAYGVSRDIFLKVDEPMAARDLDPLGSILLNKLKRLSIEGDVSNMRNRYKTSISFLPISQLDAHNKAFVITFEGSSNMPNIKCIEVSRL